MNEDLEKGSVLPFLEEARSEGWGVVVMNTNMDSRWLVLVEVMMMTVR